MPHDPVKGKNMKEKLLAIFVKYLIINSAFWAIFVGLEDLAKDKPFFSWKMLPISIAYGVLLSSFYVFMRWRELKKEKADATKLK